MFFFEHGFQSLSNTRNLHRGRHRPTPPGSSFCPRVSITLCPPSSHSVAQPQSCQAVGMAACHRHKDSGWDQRKLSHHSDTGPKDKFTFSSLSATGASVPGSPLRSPDLRKYAGTVWPRVLCLKYTLSGKDFKMWDKPPLPPSGDTHCGRREPIPQVTFYLQPPGKQM